MTSCPEILQNFRWPDLFWVEDIIPEKMRKKWIPICPPRHPSNYEKMTEHYLDCIVNDKEPLVSGQDGADSIDVMCGVFKSMETKLHRWFRINEDWILLIILVITPIIGIGLLVKSVFMGWW